MSFPCVAGADVECAGWIRSGRLNEMPQTMARIAKLALRCEQDPLQEGAAAIIAMLEILERLSDETSNKIGARPPASHVKILIGVGALESAALALLGDQCSFLLSKSSQGPSSAVVSIMGKASEPGCFSDDPAKAIVGAYCMTLAAVAKPVSQPQSANVLSFARN